MKMKDNILSTGPLRPSSVYGFQLKKGIFQKTPQTTLTTVMGVDGTYCNVVNRKPINVVYIYTYVCIERESTGNYRIGLPTSPTLSLYIYNIFFVHIYIHIHITSKSHSLLGLHRLS